MAEHCKKPAVPGLYVRLEHAMEQLIMRICALGCAAGRRQPGRQQEQRGAGGGHVHRGL